MSPVVCANAGALALFWLFDHVIIAIWEVFADSDSTLASAGVAPRPALETNSVLALLMAAAAKEFGTPRGLGAAGELFTLGLLSQIGCLALATAFPREYSDLIVRNVNRAELLDQEGVLFGTNHLRLSAALMTRWGIPVEEVCDFCQYEAFKAVPTATEIISKRRAQLASTAWHVALAIAQESTEAVFERHDCFSATQWLQLDRDSLNRSLSAIESTWHLWLALISR